MPGPQRIGAGLATRFANLSHQVNSLSSQVIVPFQLLDWLALTERETE